MTPARLFATPARRGAAAAFAVGLLLAGLSPVGLSLVGVGGAALAAERPALGEGAGVLKVRLGGDSQRTRVVVELDRETTGRVLTGAAPAAHVELALARARPLDPLHGEGSGLVRSWSVETGAGGARLVLDLARAAVVTRRFLLPPADGVSTFRYVVDVESAPNAPEAPAPASAVARAPTVRASAPAVPVSLREEAPVGPRVIVIDAGHGGKDPGSQGSGVREKDVTLAAAKSLRDMLKRTGRYKVVLTREDDTFVPLQQRVRIARRANADLFLSLHADTGTEIGLHGVSAYTLSDQGGERVSKGVFGGRDYFIDVRLPGRDPTVKQILLDLTQRETRNQSAAFADLLLDRVGKIMPLLHRGHRDAGYVVLFAPDVPAVLMEMGFLTNGEDAGRLSSGGERRRMMAGVAAAIDDYFTAARRYAAR